MPNKSILAILLLLLARGAAAEPIHQLSLPTQLRPLITDNFVRADSTIAVFDDANANVDISETTALSASYRLTDRWAPSIRLAFGGNNAPGAVLDGSSFANPMIGATYMRSSGERRLAFLAATTLPIGTGGGDSPDLRAAKTNEASITARPADDVMFEVDYLTEIVGLDVAYTTRHLTVQAEAQLQQSIRVRGDGDSARTRAVLGAHLGTFLGSHVSLGADVLYQRSLSDDLSRLMVSGGVRTHFRAGATSVHPGLSYTRGLGATQHGDMMLTNRTNAVALDLAVLF